MTSGQFVTNLWFSVGGFIVGMAFGSVLRHRLPGGQSWRVAFGLIIVAAVVTATLSLVGYSECQSKVNEEFMARLADRTAAAAVDRQADRLERDAWRRVIQGVPPGSSLEQRQAAAREINAALDEADRLVVEADRQRAANPLPPYRSCEATPW